MSTEPHARPDQIAALACGEEGHDTARAHVAGGCPRCAAALRAALGREDRRMGQLLRRVFAQEIAGVGDLDELAGRTAGWRLLGVAEGKSAPELAARLLATPTGERRGRVHHDPRFASQGLVLHLVERAREEGFREPPRAVELAALAVEVAEVLEPAGVPARLAADAQALAWAMLANAHRIQAELVEAVRAMATAKRLLATGSGHPWTVAEVLSLEGSLRTDQARFDVARRVLGEAARIYEEVGDQARLGKVLIQLSNAAGEAGDVGEAVESLVSARKALVGSRASSLLLYAGMGLARWLQVSGRIEEARTIYEELAPDFEVFVTEPTARLRFRWLGALISADEGATREALEILGQVRHAFEEMDSPYDICLVTLDLASIELERGRAEAALLLARDLYTVFAARQIHHGALAALAVFLSAVDRGRLDRDAIVRLARYLRRARNNPHLRHEP